jgi:hypothetical protein
MNQEWSDDEDNNDVEELVQPSRDFPISDNEEEEEEEDYDMYELSRMTINKKQDDLFQIKTSNNSNKLEKEEHKEKLDNKQKKIKINLFSIKNENKKNKKRQFNPRLPMPKKYNKN